MEDEQSSSVLEIPQIAETMEGTEQVDAPSEGQRLTDDVLSGRGSSPPADYDADPMEENTDLGDFTPSPSANDEAM